jgi:hypothetical protein
MVKVSDYIKVSVGKVAEAKLKKAIKTGRLNLTKADVMGNTHTLHLHKDAAKLFFKAKANNKGVNLNHTRSEIKADLMNGGSLWDFVKKGTKWVKDNWQTIKPIVSQVADLVATNVADPRVKAARVGLKALTGVGIEPFEMKELGEKLPVDSDGVITKSKVRKNNAKFVKGSAEAKAHMASIRSKRKSGGSFLTPSGKGMQEIAADGQTGGSFRAI